MRNRRLIYIIALLVSAVIVVGIVRKNDGPQPSSTSLSRLQAAVPPTLAHDGYVGSKSCQACHPSQHASWQQTYHHSMTQLATVDAVKAPFTGELQIDGQRTRLFRKGDEFWVELDDPEWERVAFLDGHDVRTSRKPRRSAHRIVMTTGSHHFQAYWLRSEYGRELWLMPWRYDLIEQKWVHRRDVFLGPPEWRPGMHFKVWNDNCIFCHSVGGRPGWDASSNYMTDTSVTELGVACEACHGPGQRHLQAHSTSGPSLVSADDSTIINPAKLDHQRSSEICGACHANFVHENPQLMLSGTAYRPGDQLERHGRFFTPDDEARAQIVSRFWSDGSNRSTGREFMGLRESACYERGELSCLSCHSMHDSDPNDQLSDGMQTNRACLQCHPAMQADVTAHTHHAADSPGSLCYNCHMPHTSYGLFKATRSHRITSPSVERIAHKSRPNACNLCHQDQSLQWTATHLSTWYDMASPELSPDEQTKSAWMLWLLKGDAGLRVVTAWHARSMAAKQAADSDWQDIPLARLIDDPYTAVQWVTRRSLQSFDGWQDLSQQDFYANDATRHALTNATLQRTRTRMMESPALVRKLALLLQVDAEITTIENELTRILAQRDDRPIASVE